ncbi:hypothetical protein MKX03_009483, partial [Papaver bracteatum]
ASTRNTSKDVNANVVTANRSNSNITSNAGTEIVLSTREEGVMTSAKGVKSMAEKGQGGDDVVNSSVGDKNKATSAGSSIATAAVSAKGQTSVEEMKDGKAVKNSNNTVEASEDSCGTEEGWITVERKKKWNKKPLEASQRYTVRGKKKYSVRNTNAKGVERRV